MTGKQPDKIIYKVQDRVAKACRLQTATFYQTENEAEAKRAADSLCGIVFKTWNQLDVFNKYFETKSILFYESTTNPPTIGAHS